MNKKSLFLSGILLAVAFASPLIVMAATDPALAWIEGIFNNFLTIVLWPLFAALVVIMFIWAGFMYLTANGEPSKIAAAHRAVIYGVIGIIVAILGMGAINFIKGYIIPPAGINACDTDADCSAGVCCTDNSLCNIGTCYNPGVPTGGGGSGSSGGGTTTSFGACCMSPDTATTCIISNPSAGGCAGGDFKGAGTTCSPNPCLFGAGHVCSVDGDCASGFCHPDTNSCVGGAGAGD